MSYKLKTCQRNLDNVFNKIQKGELVDMGALKDGNGHNQNDDQVMPANSMFARLGQ